MDIVIGIILIAAALALVITVMLQDSKDKMSGVITGNNSSDTFYGKNKGKGTDRLLNKITTVAAVVFSVLVLVSFVIQDDNDLNEVYKQTLAQTEAVETTPAETEAENTPAETNADAAGTEASEEAAG